MDGELTQVRPAHVLAFGCHGVEVTAKVDEDGPVDLEMRKQREDSLGNGGAKLGVMINCRIRTEFVSTVHHPHIRTAPRKEVP